MPDVMSIHIFTLWYYILRAYSYDNDYILYVLSRVNQVLIPINCHNWSLNRDIQVLFLESNGVVPDSVNVAASMAEVRNSPLLTHITLCCIYVHQRTHFCLNLSLRE